MKSILKTLFAVGILFSSALLLGCQNADPQPTTPIFSGTKEISLTSPLHNITINTSTNFLYTVPAEVKFVVFGVFNAEIVTNGSIISNEANFVYGSRTGLSDFVSGNQTQASMHAYDSATKNFKSPNSPPTSTGSTVYYWAVWGYDQYGNLTHSSPARKFTL